ncbi:ferritin-3, chloroplastic [Trifolium repens]|nr:ferritin-3, chloroplastic [Trifolium repens]
MSLYPTVLFALAVIVIVIATLVTLQEDQPFILHLISSKSKSWQNICGGRVVLYPIVSPPSEFNHVEKGDALYGVIVKHAN